MIDWIVQTSFLGDAVLTLPLVHRWVANPDRRNRRLKIIAAPRNVAIFERARSAGLAPWANQIEIVVWNKSELRNPLQLRRWVRQTMGETLADRVFCVQRSFSTALLAWFTGAPERVGFASGAATFFYTHCVPREWESGRHEIEKNLDLLRPFESVDVWDPRTAPSLLGIRNAQSGVVALSLSSPWATKIWDIEQAVRLMEKLVAEGHELWLLGEKSFIPLAESLGQRVDSRLVKNFVGKTNLNEWIDLIARAEVLVSGDSAAVHVANDLGVPTVALFGPTVPAFGFAPWRRNSVALGIDLACRPCDIHGPTRCPLGHHNCMKLLRAESVEASLREISGRASL